jgi:hypothetical protein
MASEMTETDPVIKPMTSLPTTKAALDATEMAAARVLRRVVFMATSWKKKSHGIVPVAREGPAAPMRAA